MTIPQKQWSILYRGSLSSCNYSCTYCPFAKTKNTRQELQEDAQSLTRFVDWVEAQNRKIGILFTPWGEALIRRSYQTQIARLSHMKHVQKVAIQTNLSCKLDWIGDCNLDAMALWTTYHPTQITRAKFLEKCHKLTQTGARFSVGVVGFKEAFDDIEFMRNALPEHVYLWVNAYKRESHYYNEADIQRIERIDPLFRYNTRYHLSKGLPCQAGQTAFTVDESGDVRRCHFIKDVIANIYEDQSLNQKLTHQFCQNERCGCHIGYVHKDDLNLYKVFGPGVLERIPDGEVWHKIQAKQRALETARTKLGEHQSTML